MHRKAEEYKYETTSHGPPLPAACGLSVIYLRAGGLMCMGSYHWGSLANCI